MSRIFVSYRSLDRERVGPLVQTLTRASFEVFWDQGVRAGEDWNPLLVDELNAADVVLVCWSASSVSSHWVQEEAARAIQQNKYFPILIDAVLHRLPLGFGRFQGRDLSERDLGDDRMLADLVEELRSRLDPRHASVAEQAIAVEVSAQRLEAARDMVAAQYGRRVREALRSGNIRAAVKAFVDYCRKFGDADTLDATYALRDEIAQIERDLAELGPTQSEAQRIIASRDEQASARLQVFACKLGLDLAATDPAPSEPLSDLGGGAQVRQRYYSAVRSSAGFDASSGVVVRAQDLKKEHEGFTLHISEFAVGVGEIVGLVGLNGSGKSTFLNVLSGVSRRSSGMLAYPYISGRFVNWPVAREKIRYVRTGGAGWRGPIQAILDATARAHPEILTVAADLAYLIDRYELKAHLGKSYDQLSTGFKVRFELVRALLGRPSLLLLDEPLANMDVVARRFLLADIQDTILASDQQVAVVLSSHNVADLDAVCDRVVILENGQVMIPNEEGHAWELHTTASAEHVRALIKQSSAEDVSVFDFSGSYVVVSPRPLAFSRVFDAFESGGQLISAFRIITGTSYLHLLKARGIVHGAVERDREAVQ